MLAGGRCEDGPLPDGTCSCKVPPCLPQRSWANRRRMAVLWTLGLTIGLLTVAMASHGNQEIIRPGPMSIHHSDISDCGACHGDVASTPSAWLAAAFETMAPGRANRGCLACHDMGKDGENVHSTGRSMLAEMTDRTIAQDSAHGGPTDVTLTSVLFQLGQEDRRDLSCATCHQEHQGSEADLSWMDNRRCQSCHAVPFESFAAGHPRPPDYPYHRRTRLIFDHVRHIDKYFEKEADKAPDRCESCHQPDPTGRSMQVASFDAMCADCHIGDIDGSARATGPKGVAFLSIPGLDLQSLEDRGAAVGGWPELSEAEVPQFLWMLLAADDALREDLALVRNVDLLDLTEASDEEIAAVQRFAWAIKALLFDWMRGGTPFIEDRIRVQLGADLDRTALNRVTAALPRDVLLGLQRDYFPGLAGELARYRAGLPIEYAAASPPSDVVEEAAPLAEETVREPAEDAADEGDLLAEDENLLLGETEPGEAEELLSESDETSRANMADNPLLIGEAETGDWPSGAGSVDAMPLPETPSLEPVDVADWALYGGWYRRDHTLFYRPSGHADRFLRTWLDLAGLSFGTEMELAGAQLFSTLTHKDAPGRCTKCHSIDREADGRLNVKWHPAERTGWDGSRALFVHAPHFALLTAEGCLSCHRLEETGDYLESYTSFDARTFHGGFKAIDLGDCAECHRAGLSGDDCVQCHRYHFGRPKVSSLKTQLNRQQQQ
jgi:hypothetical protein